MTTPATNRVDTVALAIPAYNEADGIAGFLTDLDAVLDRETDEHTFVIVNDRSTDSTIEVIETTGRSLTGRVDLRTNPENVGHGPSVLRAYQGAIDSGATWIVQVDGDGQFEAEDLVLLFDAASQGATIVTGARDQRFDPWYRKIVTRTLPAVLRAAFGVRRRDVNCPFRLYRSDVLQEILADVPADSLTPHVLMTVLEGRSQAPHRELVVRHRVRRGDSEVGTTWRDGRSLVIPASLLRFLRNAFGQLVSFWKVQRQR